MKSMAAITDTNDFSFSFIIFFSFIFILKWSYVSDSQQTDTIDESNLNKNKRVLVAKWLTS